MQLMLGNAAGLWALLGIPVILAIHFIQQRSRQQRCSTLFLLETLTPESAEGRRIDWIRSSSSLWWQLLCVLILTWVLSGPRWISTDSVQRIVVVLDSSVSMRAFKDEMRQKLVSRLAQIERLSARTEWVIAQTDPARFDIHSGGDLAEVDRQIARWQPQIGSHDVSPAIEVAKRISGRSGNIIFVSDRRVSLTGDVMLFSVGRPLPNCGLIGSNVFNVEGEWKFETLVKNFSSERLTCKWWLEDAGRKTQQREVDLAPGGVSAISGRFAQGQNQIEIALAEDGFSLDNRLPLVVPKKKTLRVVIEGGFPYSAFVRRLLRNSEEIEMVADAGAADLQIIAGIPSETQCATNCLLFTRQGAGNGPAAGTVIGEPHPLLTDLQWDGLIAVAGDNPERKRFAPVLWQKDRVLIAHSRNAVTQELLLNFDFRVSNADRHSAVIILLHRFLESVRSTVPRFERLNLESNQLLPLPASLTSGELKLRITPPGSTDTVEKSLSPSQAQAWRLASEPAILELEQDGRQLFLAAVAFADSREADFHDAETIDETGGMTTRSLQRNTVTDFYLPFWLVLLSLAILANWLSQIKKQPRKNEVRT